MTLFYLWLSNFRKYRIKCSYITKTASIDFNGICIKEDLLPNYINIHIFIYILTYISINKYIWAKATQTGKKTAMRRTAVREATASLDKSYASNSPPPSQRNHLRTSWTLSYIEGLKEGRGSLIEPPWCREAAVGSSFSST